MKRNIFIILLLSIVMFSFSQKKELKIANELDESWAAYVDSCSNDSTLFVYWLYQGDEKEVFKLDTIKNVPTKTLTIVPTQISEFKKETPSWEGYKSYLKKITD